MTNGLEGPDKIAKLNALQDFMKTFNTNLQEVQGFNTPIKGGISFNDLSSIDDPELANDLKLLTNNNADGSVNTDNTSSGELSADKNIKSFSKVIGNYLNDVNSTYLNADKAQETLMSGGNIDIHSVMIAAEKANMGMQLTLQLRNKILQAYQEISKTQV